MQTFLPYKDFVESANILDNRRLGKQRVEVLQLVNISLKIKNGEPVAAWANHPARLMWKDNLYALCDYGIAICDEWIRRGYKDTVRTQLLNLQKNFQNNGLPIWIGSEDFHKSHKSNLLRKGKKDAEKTEGSFNYYSPFAGFDKVPDDLPYVWPVRKGQR